LQAIAAKLLTAIGCVTEGTRLSIGESGMNSGASSVEIVGADELALQICSLGMGAVGLSI
jgi:hypothetical protein